MHDFELIRGALFVGLIGLVFASAMWFLLMAFLRRPLSLRRQWLPRISWGSALLGIACFLYGYFVEPYWPEITHVQIATPKLKPSSSPIRLVHISDVHSDPKVRLEERLPDLIAAEKPDLIVFTGDSVNSPEGLANFKHCFTRLAQIAPTYAVRGNWDAYIWPELDRYSQTGVTELVGKPVKVSIRNTDLWLTGIPADKTHEAATALQGIPEGALTVLLHHYPYPDVVSEQARSRIDLFCAGHVHGGQVALPLYGALVTLSRFGKKYERGLYHVGSMVLYVSRGIGMEGGVAPRVRFCSRPEITVIEVSGR